jgi:hypothetical protein
MGDFAMLSEITPREITPPEIRLPEIKIASPCSAQWEQMTGDKRARHCAECNLDVYNFSEMTSAEIEALTAARAGERLCGRLYQRADGTILTRDCPVGLRAKIRRVSRRLTGALAAAMSLFFATECAKPLMGQALVMGKIRVVQTGFNLTVVDSSGVPLPHAEVSVLDLKTHKTITRGMTDQFGKFSLSHTAAGDYIVAAHIGRFRSNRGLVSIKLNQMQNMTLALNNARAFTTGLVMIYPLPVQPK